MTEQKNKARQWAEGVLSNPEAHSEMEIAAAKHTIDTTPPLTMDGVEWDSEKHYLAGATAFGGKEVMMIRPTRDDTCIVTDKGTWLRGLLTPNGKRYELREVGAPEQPEHPETLVTEQDYENAPTGTVVAEHGGFARTKGYDGNWYRGGDWLTNGLMAGTERQVLRWRWGK